MVNAFLHPAPSFLSPNGRIFLVALEANIRNGLEGESLGTPNLLERVLETLPHHRVRRVMERQAGIEYLYVLCAEPNSS